MTREGHIYQLKQHLKGNNYYMSPSSKQYWQEHWEEVIEALEQEPTTKIDCDKTDCNNCVNHKCCDYEPTIKNDLGVDCISRADALDCVNIGVTFCDVYKKINDLPSIRRQEPKTGHWTEHPHEWGDDWQYSDYECSICHNWTHFEHDFCPNCGAKMD